jgi:hypothetical protein
MCNVIENRQRKGAWYRFVVQGKLSPVGREERIEIPQQKRRII